MIFYKKYSIICPNKKNRTKATETFFLELLQMANSNSFNKLQVQLCELKLEERRVKSDITKLVKNKQMIDFYQAQQLNKQKTIQKRR